jgi:hypothetical protein
MTIVESSRIFATGMMGTSGLDSLTTGNGSLWAEYGNGANSTGGSGSSTIVEYSLAGKVEQTFTIDGSADGLKIDPATGMVWVLQNQDGNSTLSLIDPKSGTVSGPLTYAVASATNGYDDVAFDNGQVYLSYTNPNGSGDPVVQTLTNGNQPIGNLVTTNILLDGATGTDITTGQTDQPIPLNDPDSLKALPDGRLVLSSGADNSFTLISDPGTAAQSERFVQLTNLPAGSALDDVVVPTSSSGTFYVSNAGTNQIQAYKVSGLNTSDAYASVGTEIVQVDLQTGKQTPLITGLSSAHGLSFVPSPVKGPVVQSESVYAIGSEVGGATQPDSITKGDNSYFIEYGNGADSTGKLPNSGSSTIVQYSPDDNIEHTYTLPGSIDGLKFDPATGQLWALENQDANSLLYLIDPTTQQVSAPLSYDAPYVYGTNSARGFDDVAFQGKHVFMSYTNPVNVGDSVIAQLDNGNNPTGKLELTSILRLGDTGTNLKTGQVNQPLPVADPDSLKTLPNGSLILTSDHDSSLIFISHPGTAQQSASFISLPAGSAGLDDAIMPTATSGTFYIANGGANDVVKASVTGLNTKDIYVSVGSDNAVDQLDLTTGQLTPFIVGLNSPHGLLFVPSEATPASAAGSSIADLINGLPLSVAGDFSTNNPLLAATSVPGSANAQPPIAASAFAAMPVENMMNALLPSHTTHA